MMLDKKWRESVYSTLLRRSQEDSMKTKDDVKELFNKVFENFSEPIKELTEMEHGEGISKYKAYDRAIEVKYQDSNIIFYRVFLNSNGEEVKKEFYKELKYNGKVFVEMVGNGQSDNYVNDELLEIFIKNCFELGLSLRY